MMKENTSNLLPSLNIGAWKDSTIDALISEIMSLAPCPLILIDGAGGSGKSTLANIISKKLEANLVHTDDVCWYGDIIDWDQEVIHGIIEPWRSRENVSYRPSGWVLKNRSGAIKINPLKPLIIEGMGADRKTLLNLADYSIWVETEPETARERLILRDIETGENGGTRESSIEFANWFDSQLTPFLLEESPWDNVNIIVNGMNLDNIKEEIQVHTLVVSDGDKGKNHV